MFTSEALGMVCTQSCWLPATHPAQAVEDECSGLQLQDGVHLTLLPRNTYHLAPAPRALQNQLALSEEGGEAPAEKSCRAQGVSNPQKDLTSLSSVGAELPGRDPESP